MSRVLIVDDHAIVREGLKQLFSLTEDILVTGEAGNGKEVLDALDRSTFDVILLDMNLPDIGGIDLIGRIRQLDAPPILVFSMHKEPQVVKRVLAAGASGYLSKNIHPDILPQAIRVVAAGGRFIEPALAEKVVLEVDTSERRSPREVLSKREYQVFLLLLNGTPMEAIASQLCISRQTVGTHKTRLMRKLNLHNNTEIVRFAIKHGLISL